MAIRFSTTASESGRGLLPMTMYKNYKKLDIDFSQIGLVRCCFVKGFGEMVFAVNPSNLNGLFFPVL